MYDLEYKDGFTELSPRQLVEALQPVGRTLQYQDIR